MEEEVHSKESEERKEREKARESRMHGPEEGRRVSVYSIIQQILFEDLLCVSHGGGRWGQCSRQNGHVPIFMKPTFYWKR